MNSFDILGQAKIDAAEGQALLARRFGAWLNQIGQRLRGAMARNRSESRATPW